MNFSTSTPIRAPKTSHPRKINGSDLFSRSFAIIPWPKLFRWRSQASTHPPAGFGHGRSQHAKPNQRPSQICCMQNQCTPKLAAPFPSFLFFQQLLPPIKSHRRRGRQPREHMHVASSRWYGSELLGITASLFRAAPSSSPEGDAASDVKARRRGSGGPGPSERDGRRSRDLPSSMAGGTQRAGARDGPPPTREQAAWKTARRSWRPHPAGRASRCGGPSARRDASTPPRSRDRLRCPTAGPHPPRSGVPHGRRCPRLGPGTDHARDRASTPVRRPRRAPCIGE